MQQIATLDDKILSIRATDSTANPINEAINAFGHALKRAGLYSRFNRRVPSRKTGGFKFAEVMASENYGLNFPAGLDVFIALDPESMSENLEYYTSRFDNGNTLVILDDKRLLDPAFDPVKEYLSDFQLDNTTFQFMHLPLSKLSDGDKNLINTAIGYLGQQLDVPLDILNDVFAQSFSGLKPPLLKKLKNSLAAGYNLEQEIEKFDLPKFEFNDLSEYGYMHANQVLAEALLELGVNFTAAYPITPATSIIEVMKNELWARYGPGSFVQAMDERSALAIAIGRVWGGIQKGTERVAVVTSDPGISLMSENLGVAYDLPMLIVNVMRGGYVSTGDPTGVKQGALRQAKSPTHGDALFPVIAPRTVDEMYSAAANAYNIIEELCMPVMFLSDGGMSVRNETIHLDSLTEGLKIPEIKAHPDRTVLTGLSSKPDGRPIKGYHHEDALAEAKRYNDRIQKLRDDDLLINKREDLDFYAPEGKDKKDIAVLAWGSTWYAAREAVEILGRQGYNAHLISTQQVFPLQDSLIDQLAEYNHVILPELNFTGQLAEILKTECDSRMDINNIYSIDPQSNEMFIPDEIVAEVKEIYKGAKK
ncbi:hypothetical protein HN789_00400 [archaeon]|nr:hypothetical protein [archaeon]MBT4023186.1 hypothetical protein [archaeon]MBT4272392.1 hypothetical protein [archaeon]MBT4460699.1 hypothetical protein [archaeon]MBT4859131.1 hypothetical protein [archaeon]